MTTAFVTHPRYIEHHMAGHPEHAGRIRAVWQEMEHAGLMSRVTRLEPEPIGDELIRTVHSERYIELLHWLDTNRKPHMQHLDGDTYCTPTSIEVARLSAGGVVRAVDEVLSGRAQNALAAVRPPGHHAMPDHAMGFCILGNVPIATRYAQQQYGLRRVMIVDYDVHHGNGTEAMFYDDGTVLFISSHQAPFYPGTGAITDTGRDAGAGYTLNIPLAAGHGDRSFAALYEDVLWPVARRFQPELIIVSAGFDSHWLDPIAGMRLSLTGYAHLSRELIRMADAVCGGKIVFAMEGGYNLEALSHGLVNITHALLGDSTVSDPLGPPRILEEPDVQPLIARLKTLHHLD
jgi:acetoin utilization deacetylase AcuC-like enzyme